jgi:flavin-dependent dehydrogenase
MARVLGKSLNCDVLVIGGGPAGSTIATLLSDLGWNVVLIDKDRHPRFHIGESLLPRSLPIFSRLGVLDDVARIAVTKYGADLSPPTGVAYCKFAFAEANADQPNAFQVKRAEFDALLLDNARARGARILEGTKASETEIDGDGQVRITSLDDKGKRRVWRARFLVDASGRDAFMASRLKLKVRDPRHNSAAVFAHFDGVERRQGLDAGNTSVIWFDKGWFWTIPLPDGNDSVGVVCDPDYLRTRRSTLDQFLVDAIASCPQIDRRMGRARPVTPVYAAGNYSYKARAMFGERFLLIGDAYAFLDPIFSTGVYLAMESAARGAETVDACLSDPANAQRHLARHARIMDRGLERLAWFIYRFNSPAMQTLFLSSVNPLNMRKAVISLLAGDVFGAPTGGVAVPAFKLAYHVLGMIHGSSRAALPVS